MKLPLVDSGPQLSFKDAMCLGAAGPCASYKKWTRSLGQLWGAAHGPLVLRHLA